jgi:glycosyltransferase involved in cell wall biosynthesis
VRGLRVYYIFFHDVHFVPIHASEIILEMKSRGAQVHVFTSIKEEAEKGKLLAKGIRLHNLWTIETRFVSELLFMALLYPYLFVRTLIRRPDIFYTRHSACSFVATLIAKVFKIPCLLEINDIVQDRLKFSNIPSLKLRWVQLYHYINYHLADLLLPVTEQIGQFIEDNYSMKWAKLVVITNAVNIHRFSPKPCIEARRRYHIPLESEVVLSLGSLFPWAGIDVLIAAAPKILERFPNTLFIVGSGEEPYVSKLKKAVHQSGLNDNFLFFGFIPWDEASWFISTADICVAPYILKTTQAGLSSLRVFSYLACGKPVIGSDIPGLGDMLQREGIGFSFRMGDHEALAGVVITVLDDRDRLQHMGEKGRDFVVNNYSWEIIVDKLEALFDGLIGTTKR